jgi:two-component system, NarL family, nitrate/nitrite response regulator NarL
MALIDDGLSNQQIARRLCIEVPTVKNHVHSILDKLGASSRTEAAARARKLAWNVR